MVGLLLHTYFFSVLNIPRLFCWLEFALLFPSVPFSNTDRFELKVPIYRNPSVFLHCFLSASGSIGHFYPETTFTETSIFTFEIWY